METRLFLIVILLSVAFLAHATDTRLEQLEKHHTEAAGALRIENYGGLWLTPFEPCYVEDEVRIDGTCIHIDRVTIDRGTHE